MRTRRRPAGLIGFVVTILLMAGCASIPDSGTIRSAAPDPDEQIDPIFDPPGPQPGAAPEELVLGFVNAMQAQPVTTETAREFLTDEASEKWDADKQTVIYSGSPTQQRVSEKRIELTMDTYATLDRRGAFTPKNGDDRSLDLTLQKIDGQWRITDMPDVFLVQQSLFEDSFRALSLYFMSDSRRTALPDPVYLPEGDQLATSVLDRLLLGPSEPLGEVATTFLPEDTALDVSVRVRDKGVAEVRLAGDLDDLDDEVRQLLSAQVVLTLRQVPGVTAVEILANDVPYDVPGVDETQPAEAWNRYDASVSTTRTPLFAVRDDRLVLVNDDDVQPVVGPWDRKREPIGDFAVDWPNDRIAVVNDRRTTVSVGSTAIDDTRRRQILSGNQLLAPRWDPYGSLWIADARRGATTLSVWRDGGLRTIPIGPLEGMQVRSMALAPDGTRFAAVATDPGAKRTGDTNHVYTGLIRRTESGEAPAEVIDVHRVPLESSDLRRPASVAWRDPTNLVVLAERDTLSRQPYVVSIDGSTVTGGTSAGQPPLPDIGATSVAASGRISDPIYVGDDDGELWKLSGDQRWTTVGEGKLWAPHYPG